MLTNWKIVTGIALSLLLSAISLAPVKADSMDDNKTETQDQGQMDSTQKTRGKIVSIVGSIITVRLENGDTKVISTGSHIQTVQLREGMDVYVANNEIVGIAPAVAVQPTQTDDFKSRTSALLEQLSDEQTTTVTPAPRRVETTETQPVETQERTYEAPAPEPEPVRGLW